MDREIEEYILAHIDAEDEVLSELNRETHLKIYGSRMISGHLQGQILTMLSKMISPENILEIGTFTGYSAICLAKGLTDNGKLYTIEKNDELEYLTAKYFAKAGLQHKIIRITGNALDEIRLLDEMFDLVYIDADKRQYTNYYNLVFDKVRSGGYIIADNTLWNEKVIQRNISRSDSQTLGIIEFNEMVKSDSRIEKVILPVRDGMTIIRKK